ncbi:MAG: 4Fe-4S binding protein [Cocleimonas sp.]|nr:4Fe-4S binding protein [Cocleimonas sp.]
MTITKNKAFGDGNDAIAWAAQDAAVDYISHYPGSPVNRVIEVLEKDQSNPHYLINHALNEHIAALATIGASLCGARSLLVMKHVGLNIAADPLNYAAVTKIKGGMVIVVGTDPGARTSTGEEDVHWYAPQFNLPLLEPSTVPSVYQRVKQAFDISEQTQLPVLVFVAGRIAYQSHLIQRTVEQRVAQPFAFHKDPENLINVGAKAVRNHRDHLLRLKIFQETDTSYTSLHFNPEAHFGIITRGASYAVCYEVIESLRLTQHVHLLNIERVYPLHKQSVIDFSVNKKNIVIIEDQDGFLETMIKRELFGKITSTLQGKDIFPAWGELTDQPIRDYLSTTFQIKITNPLALSLDVDCPERAGTFCEGCPHRSTFYGIDQALKAIGSAQPNGIIGGDIGCSSLPPHRTDWLLCMNAGIGISQGIAHLLPDQPLISTGGEGSFFHGGLISLQSAVENNINLTHVIFDNRSVAMTGHQASPTTTNNVDLKKLLAAIGVQHIFSVNAFLSSEITQTLTKAQQLTGVKVIWVQGDCALQPNKEALRRFKHRRLILHNDRCKGCSLCYSTLQCPAIIKDQQQQLSIDLDHCRRCTACLDVCPNDAIEVIDPNGL